MTDPINSAPPFLTARPAIIVDGQDQPELANGLLKYLIVENARGLCRCEVTVGNWGPTADGAGYLYFDRRIVDFGKRLEVRLETATLFDGQITALEAQFPQAGPPALVILAAGNLPRAGRGTRRGGPALDLHYGERLREFSAIVKGFGQSGSVVGRGVAETDGSLRAGARVNLTGLGSPFSGVYRVTEVTHRFDKTGYRSEFTARQSGSR
jgi:hypothetical protein